MRVKLDFANFRYINKGDQVEFWNEYKGSHRCEGHVIGKSDEFMLLKMPHFSRCTRKVALFSGIYLKFFAKNLVENLKKRAGTGRNSSQKTLGPLGYDESRKGETRFL